MSHDSTADPIEEEGFFPTLRRKLFGARIARLSERKASAHFLSYLMIVAQSIAVLLVFGHAEVPLLLSGNVAVSAIAVLVLFLLIITVIAADWALIESVLRLGALARNRQFSALMEHLAYIVFVLLTEGVTYGVVLIVVETHPQALVQPAPIIPTGGLLFFAIAFLRVVLSCWTIVQLIIVATTLPVTFSTLMAQAKEVVGAHALRQMAHLDIRNVSVSATVKTYGRMDTPPRPIRSWWNGWLVERAIAKEAEEARRTALVVDALQELVVPTGETVIEHVTATPVPSPETTPPDGPRGGGLTHDTQGGTTGGTNDMSYEPPVPMYSGRTYGTQRPSAQGGLNTGTSSGTKRARASGTKNITMGGTSHVTKRRVVRRRLTVGERNALDHATAEEVRQKVASGEHWTQTRIKTEYGVSNLRARDIWYEVEHGQPRLRAVGMR